MAMLACTHHVAWIKPVAAGKHQCTYCKAVVAKKDLYPKFDELGPDFQARWDAHAAKPAPAATVKPAVTAPAAQAATSATPSAPPVPAAPQAAATASAAPSSPPASAAPAPAAEATAK